jgi:hypothetical protein
MVEPLRHRQTKGAATDMFYLKPPRHISTLPDSDLGARGCQVRFTPMNCPTGYGLGDLSGPVIWAVESCLQKFSRSRLTQIKTITRAVSSPAGAYRDRHGGRARDAVDAAALGARRDGRAGFYGPVSDQTAS